MVNRKVALLAAIIPCFSVVVMFGTAAQDSSGAPMLSGTIRAATGEPLGGVVVSARPEGKNFTKSVYTDERGEFYFPVFEAPFEPGEYRVWAQAVGFERTSVTMDLTSAPSRQNLVLNTVKDFTNQLSGTEWMDALPAETHEDRRMKEILPRQLHRMSSAWPRAPEPVRRTGLVRHDRSDGAGDLSRVARHELRAS